MCFLLYVDFHVVVKVHETGHVVYARHGVLSACLSSVSSAASAKQ